ncbi:hypothetical protein NL676_011432 [Syzygium grande]|nr:hypothetical protein NL676_011432 [Syzygium grande]
MPRSAVQSAQNPESLTTSRQQSGTNDASPRHDRAYVYTSGDERTITGNDKNAPRAPVLEAEREMQNPNGKRPIASSFFPLL